MPFAVCPVPISLGRPKKLAPTAKTLYNARYGS